MKSLDDQIADAKADLLLGLLGSHVCLYLEGEGDDWTEHGTLELIVEHGCEYFRVSEGEMRFVTSELVDWSPDSMHGEADLRISPGLVGRSPNWPFTPEPYF